MSINAETGRNPRLLLLIAIALLALVLACNSPLSTNCEDYDVQEVDSPDGRHVARSSYRDCGATTSGISSVTVRRVNQSEADARTAFSVKRRHSLFMIWESDAVLSVECLDCAPSEQSLVKYRVQ